jgi:D-beta-D-heptose 7-phosphate kinase/D-beta-D-heptose 1-phosphate adenosyltransferase
VKIGIPAFESARVLVAGDVMLDRYWYGSASRISPEAPVPVVHVGRTEERPGGAGNVAVNIAALGAQATLIGLTGVDGSADALQHMLSAAGVRHHLERIAGLTTITKLRVISQNQQLIRLDFEDDIVRRGADSLVASFRRELAGADVVILSDYVKGTLRATRALIEAARAAGKPVLVDPKSRDFEAYRGATVLTPNLAEFEAVVGACGGEREILEKSAALIERLDLDAVLLTRGEHGMTLLRRGIAELHFPTEAREVYDVTGAGDTVIAVLAASLAAGQDLPAAAALANLAAGIVVGKLGTATVSALQLRRAVHERLPPGSGDMSREQLLQAVVDARAHGELIVMTNGCFDILHAGHVAYLKEARRLGDRLIVAVNDDDSVRRMKGAGRPINSLARRMAVLAGLGSVDWVVPFGEDTPESLICEVRPDLLVKGGDYRPEDVAGHRCVTARGGQVVILDYLDGYSTTSLIEAIRRREP